ncbi:TPA: hypothetical protein ACH3X1_013614 [Trebouxia sp. C0004]
MAQTNSKSDELGEQQSAVALGNSQPANSSQQQDVLGSRSAWFTKWTSVPVGPIPHITTRPDYRSRLPPRVQEVAAQFRPVVQDGQWTTGLFECWFHKHRIVKSAVHIPCWEACRINPCAWDGFCFGRTGKECWWTGWHDGRWARAAHGAQLGSEYRWKRGENWHGTTAALGSYVFALNLALSILLSFGFGVGGSFCLSFVGFTTCHSRLHMRRKYGLQSACCLPQRIDDCLVHTCCMYCASHQEIRELAYRGHDGPGISILDVLPQSFKHLPGAAESIAARQVEVQFLIEAQAHGKSAHVPPTAIIEMSR